MQLTIDDVWPPFLSLSPSSPSNTSTSTSPLAAFELRQTTTLHRRFRSVTRSSREAQEVARAQRQKWVR